MSVNPMAVLALKSSFDKFKNNHPKFVQFIKALMQTGLQEETVLDCKVVTPDGKEIQANLKITADDLELLRQLKEMQDNVG